MGFPAGLPITHSKDIDTRVLLTENDGHSWKDIPPNCIVYVDCVLMETSFFFGNEQYLQYILPLM